MDNTHIIQISGTNDGLLGQYPDVPYLDGFYFNAINSNTFSFPTTTYCGPLTAGTLPDPIPDNWDGGVTFTTTNSGGPLYNYSYDDFSRKISTIFLGNFFCTPTLVLSFTGYDETKSFIKRITYSFKDVTKTITSEVSSMYTTVTNLTSTDLVKVYTLISPKLKNIYLNCSPDSEYLKAETIYVDVIKADNTVNKLLLNFNIIQCGLLSIYNQANILNSQLLDSADKLLLTLEDKTTKNTFQSIVDINTPFYLVTGGDIQLPTQDVELETFFDIEGTTTNQPVFIAEQIQQQALEVPTIPVPTPMISPLNPEVGEYYYRGEKGIRIRPLLSRLLPGDEFYYERPSSGLILSDGGAPYYPGKGVLYNLEFRVI